MSEKFEGTVHICVGRESGSGGRRLAMHVGEALGIPCYDKELVAMAAEKSGLCEEILKSHDEKSSKNFLYSLMLDSFSVGYHSTPMDMPMQQKAFLAQYDTIKDIASKGSCIFVGRCADYALEADPDMISIFVSGDYPDKIEHLMSGYGFDEKEAKDYMEKTDKRRSNYYNYYSNKKWGDARSYDLCINRSKLGLDGSVKAIVEYVLQRKRFEAEQRAKEAESNAEA